MKIDNISKESCVGCESCSQVCPKNCISMTSDSEGFKYPIIDNDNCINCGLCLKSCPVYNTCQKEVVHDTISVIAKDKQILLNSSSGGMFTLISKYVLAQNGVVFGAGYNDEFEVVHKFIEESEQLPLLQKSKYVQSSIGDSFSKTQFFLKQERIVLFVGTPCQIAGLKKFLRIEYDNLITMDLICSGVPSPMIWKDYVKLITGDGREKMENIDFREKSMGWKDFSFSVSYSTGKVIKSRYSDNAFMKAFISKLINRPSCSKCKFINENHFSDLTIGDFWGIENFNVNNFELGASLVITNSEKGKNLVSFLWESANIQYHDYDSSIKENWPLYKNYKDHVHRKVFFKNYDRNTLVEDIEKTLTFNIFERVLIKLGFIKI